MGVPNEAQDCHRHPELKRRIYSALQEGDEGELAIAIPREVPLKQSGHLQSGLVFSEGEYIHTSNFSKDQFNIEE
jgi:transcription initiation factor TFIID subunit 2